MTDKGQNDEILHNSVVSTAINARKDLPGYHGNIVDFCI